MQIICGQCGRQHKIEKHPSDDVFQCTRCGHYVILNPESDKSEFDSTRTREDDDSGFAKLAQKQLTRRMIIFCSSCGEQIKITKRMAGRVIRCRFCAQVQRVPFLDEDDQTGADRPGETPDPYQSVLGIHKAAALAGTAADHRQTSKGFFWFVMVVSVAICAASIIRYKPQIRDYLKSLFVASSESGHSSPAEKIHANPTGPAASPVLADWTFFAHDGYLPARPGSCFCKLTIEIQAGERPLRFENSGQAVFLSDSRVSYPSLGEAIPAGDFSGPAKARSRNISVRPNSRQKFTLIFELPVFVREASLHIGPLGAQPIVLPKLQQPAQPLDGEYVEQLPRNCRPLPQDPVMAEIQAVTRQMLNISHRNGVMTVDINGAEISGRGRYLDEHLYELTLVSDNDVLVCKLRQIDDSRVILYLQDDPMNQITFIKTDALRRLESDSEEGDTGHYDMKSPADFDGF